MGLTIDASGTLYVADKGNEAIRRITPAGEVTTVASNGPGTASPPWWFHGPQGVAKDSAGNLYVANTRTHTIVRITPAGKKSELAGRSAIAGAGDGTGDNAFFSAPIGLAIDATDTIYVADSGNHLIRKVTPDGVVTTFAGQPGTRGSFDSANGAWATFDTPGALAIDSQGNLFVADTGNHLVRKISPLGSVTTVAGTARKEGHLDGQGLNAMFSHPAGITVAPSGALFVADSGSHTIRRVTPEGAVSTLAGTPGKRGALDGPGLGASFDTPRGLALDGTGTLYVVDERNHSIRAVTPDGEVTTFAGRAEQSGYLDGARSTARLDEPTGVALDPISGNLYVTDAASVIRKVRPSGVSTFAGDFRWCQSRDGTGKGAKFHFPMGLAVDASGNLYVAESGAHTLRKATPQGVVTTLAGSPDQAGHADGSGREARFDGPRAVAVGPTGDLFVTDGQTIRRVTVTGVVTTIAGSPGEAGAVDGTGNAARFNAPVGLAVDPDGNIFVTDFHNYVVRRVTPSGEVSTFAGRLGERGLVDGVGDAARLDLVQAITRDPVSGNLYVADTATIRRVTPAGEVTTVVGVPWRRGVAVGPLPGSLNSPRGLAVLPTGDLVVSDWENVVLLVRW